MFDRRGVLAGVTVGALSLVACGPDAGPEGGLLGGAGTSNAGMGGGGQAMAGASGSGGSVGAAAGASTGGATVGGATSCTSFADASGWSLMVQITNQRKEPVYLGQDTMSCQVERLFQVENGSRAVLPSLEGCHSSCQTLMVSGPTSCPLVCQTPSTVTLKPGETLKLPWDGRFAVPQNVPSSCLQGPQGTTNCVQTQRIEASVFTFSARAGTRQQCVATGGACSCAPNQNGGCTTPSSLITGTLITTETLIKLEPGEASPSGEPPYIGLVFKD
jgi:hypothetical protein